MQRKPRVAVIGAGELGKALVARFLVAEASVRAWDIDLRRRSELSCSVVTSEEAVADADHVFFAVPSWAMRKAVTSLLPAIPSAATIVSLAKGMEKETLKTMAELLDEVVPKHHSHAVVGGPMLAEEIVSGQGGVAVIASKNEMARRAVRDLFNAPDLQTEMSDDPFSVSLAGVLKNIYAIALGIADGLNLSADKKGWLAARALDEMANVAKHMGADVGVILGTAGAADLIATGYSEYSRNREVGHEIATKGTCPLESEGVTSLIPLLERLGPGGAAFPLLHVIKSIAVECKPAKATIESYV